MDIKVFEVCEYDMVAATSEEETKKWYELNYDKLDDGDITELDIDKNGMWYPTEKPEDLERLEKEGECKHTPTQFDDLMWFEGFVHKFTPYRKVIELSGEYKGPYIIASSEW